MKLARERAEEVHKELNKKVESISNKVVASDLKSTFCALVNAVPLHNWQLLL